jgi:hypothetical protein
MWGAGFSFIVALLFATHEIGMNQGLRSAPEYVAAQQAQRDADAEAWKRISENVEESDLCRKIMAAIEEDKAEGLAADQLDLPHTP